MTKVINGKLPFSTIAREIVYQVISCDNNVIVEKVINTKVFIEKFNNYLRSEGYSKNLKQINNTQYEYKYTNKKVTIKED